MERISCIIGIYGSLHAIFSDSAQADSWIRRVNFSPQFGGRSALHNMAAGRLDDLRSVRQHLDGNLD